MDKNKEPGFFTSIDTGRGITGTTMQIYNNMDPNAIQKIISSERLSPYLAFHNGNLNDALIHYKTNIEISEAFYPLLSILEIGLRNNIDQQLKRILKLNK